MHQICQSHLAWSLFYINQLPNFCLKNSSPYYLDNFSHPNISFSFISLPFDRGSNLADTSGLFFLLYLNCNLAFSKIVPSVAFNNISHRYIPCSIISHIIVRGSNMAVACGLVFLPYLNCHNCFLKSQLFSLEFVL